MKQIYLRYLKNFPNLTYWEPVSYTHIQTYIFSKNIISNCPKSLQIKYKRKLYTPIYNGKLKNYRPKFVHNKQCSNILYDTVKKR